MQGKVQESTGKGVFQYFVDQVPTATKTKEYHRLEGWYGYDNDEKSNRWNATKMSSRVKKRLQQRSPSQKGKVGEDFQPSVGFEANQAGGEAASETEAEREETPVPSVQPKSTESSSDDLF